MENSADYLQVNPNLLRKWNSHTHISPTTSLDDLKEAKEQEKEQEKEKEKRLALLKKAKKEQCKFRMIRIGKEGKASKKGKEIPFFEFTMASPEVCAEWLDDISRLREEQAAILKANNMNSIIITHHTESANNEKSPRKQSIIGSHFVPVFLFSFFFSFSFLNFFLSILRFVARR
mgnify:FL=1